MMMVVRPSASLSKAPWIRDSVTVSSADVVMIARSIVQLTEIPAERVFLADVNHDGMVSLADAIYLARYIIGLEYLL